MKKLLNKKGFTLMEMLIVVAIIVILVAISVPTFTANLDEAKTATDDANLRAAKSAGAMYALDNEIPSTGVFYDADKGDIVTTAPTGYGQAGDNKGEYVIVTVDANGDLQFNWSDVVD